MDHQSPTLRRTRRRACRQNTEVPTRIELAGDNGHTAAARLVPVLPVFHVLKVLQLVTTSSDREEGVSLIVGQSIYMPTTESLGSAW